jgi:hypothetical protein
LADPDQLDVAEDRARAAELVHNRPSVVVPTTWSPSPAHAAATVLNVPTSATPVNVPDQFGPDTV